MSGGLQGGRVGQFLHALDPSEVTAEGVPENCKWIYWCDMWTDYHRLMWADGRRARCSSR